MTETNRARNVAADAISRADYAAFHLVRAMLLTRGVEPRSHHGAIHLLVWTGDFPASHDRLLAGLQRQREIADYDAAVPFGAEDARAAVADARAFEADARAALERWGFGAASWVGASLGIGRRGRPSTPLRVRAVPARTDVQLALHERDHGCGDTGVA